MGKSCAIEVLVCLLLAVLALTPAAGLSIVPDKQIVTPGEKYSFTVEGAEGAIKAIIVNNVTKTKVDWEVNVEGSTVTVSVPEDAKFAEYILRVETSGKVAEAHIIIKPPVGIMLATFAVPIFLSIGMLGGGMYAFVKKRGIVRYVGVGVAVFGMLILFGVIMAIVAVQMV
ncbi:hypothetical protein [Archaeoglobus veneficus]|uniref:Uncharacterized protein n=1 Tax=Archaeoglobus veneficus (strain DSM 11195 / SNP6) TaxID=693661 RepID=F2KNY0_ARCVS|nr:hypothetical protein [Archaeoglobus veneficus]AEA46288.1 hypothetical protein Arcve_0251 [Archaeoglobus veneficus SNP6]